MQGAILVSCMGEDTRYGPRTIGEKGVATYMYIDMQ